MSLFKTADKWEKESQESVKIKKEILTHKETLPVAQKKYNDGCLEVARLGKAIDEIHRYGGLPENLKILNEAMTIAKRERDRSLHIYKLTETQLQQQLEAVVRLFISEKAEIWEDLKKKIPGMRINREISHVSNVNSEKIYKTSSNLEAVATFQEMLLAGLQKLFHMTDCSIPEISAHIIQVENALNAIDLTPQEVEMGGRAFADIKEVNRDSKEKERPAIGYGLSNGIHVSGAGIVQTPAEADKSLFAKANVLKERFK